MEETQTVLDMEALLDSTMDEVEQAPDYVEPPAGQYILAVHEVTLAPAKTADKPPVITTTLEVIETIQLANPTVDLPVPAGSLFSIRNNYDDKGLPYFKRNAAKILGASVDGVPMRDIFLELTNVKEVPAVVTRREYKKEDQTTAWSTDVRFTPANATA